MRVLQARLLLGGGRPAASSTGSTGVDPSGAAGTAITASLHVDLREVGGGPLRQPGGRIERPQGASQPAEPRLGDVAIFVRAVAFATWLDPELTVDEAIELVGLSDRDLRDRAPDFGHFDTDVRGAAGRAPRPTITGSGG